MPESAFDLVNRSYEEVGLILGGFLARTPVLDEMAWRLVGEMSGSWFRSASRAHSLRPVASASPSADERLHPSVRAMLAAIRSTTDGPGRE
jgi:hypothetical protein